MQSWIRLERYAWHALVAAVVLVLPGRAEALPVFPGDLRKDLDMPCTPECTVCHRDNNGGLGTLKFITIDGVKKPGFGRKLASSYGLDIGDRESLATALEKSEADASDVDGDGVIDVEELRKGDDPNDPTPGAAIACQAEESDGGCALATRRAPLADVSMLTGTTVLLLGAARLRRRGS